MDLFLVLLGKILPLYGLIGLGYLAGTRLNIPREPVATLLIYILVPVIFFGATAQMKVQREYILLPCLLFVTAVFIGSLLYKISTGIWADGRKNIIGYAMGTANQGYFGIPVFIALFGDGNLGLYVFAGLGFSLYEATVGYYLMARGSYSVRDSLFRLVRLPLLPAAVTGFLFSLAGFKLAPLALDFYTMFKGAYTILGMMLIGLSLSRLRHLAADPAFTGFLLAGKFIVWPLAGYALVTFYEYLTGTADPVVGQIIRLLSVMPLAANTAAFAAQLKVEPDKAATTVVLSTIVALFYIPWIMGINH